MRYKVPVKFVFEGHFEIEADNKAQAVEFAKKHCGMTVGAIRSTLPEDDVDWDFPFHPEKTTLVSKVRKL